MKVSGGCAAEKASASALKWPVFYFVLDGGCLFGCIFYIHLSKRKKKKNQSNIFSSASTVHLIFEGRSLICGTFHRSSRKSSSCAGQKHVISVNTVPAEDADTAAVASSAAPRGAEV